MGVEVETAGSDTEGNDGIETPPPPEKGLATIKPNETAAPPKKVYTRHRGATIRETKQSQLSWCVFLLVC